MQKKQFSDCSFQNFFGFWAKFFSDFGGNSSKSCQNYLLRVQRNNLWLEKIFKKFWFVLDFLKKPLAWFSIIYLRVQSKNCRRNSFLIFLFRFCSDFERKIFQTFGQKTSKSCQNYLLRVHRNNLWLQIFFKKLWTVLDFLQKLLAWFSKFYLRVQSKKCVRNIFLIFVFRFFSDFERNIFQTFGPKTSKSCQNYLMRVHRNNLWL